MSTPDADWLAEALHATTLEIVAAARHEAKGQIDGCHSHLLIALGAMEKKDSERAREAIMAAANELTELSRALDKMGLRRVEPRTKVEKFNAALVVEAAAAMVLSRLQRSGLRVDWREANVEIETVPYVLQMSVVHLLFVSLDHGAFARRRGHTVKVAWRPPTEPDTSRLVYIDPLLDPAWLERAVNAAAGVQRSEWERGEMRLAVASRLLESIGGGLRVLPSSRPASLELILPARIRVEPSDA